MAFVESCISVTGGNGSTLINKKGFNKAGEKRQWALISLTLILKKARRGEDLEMDGNC